MNTLIKGKNIKSNSKWSQKVENRMWTAELQAPKVGKKNKNNLALKASNTIMLAELSESHPDTEGFI